MSGKVADSMIDKWVETGSAIADATDLVGEYAKAMAKAAVESLLMESVFTDDAEKKLVDLMKSGKTDEALLYVSQLIDSANALAPAVEDVLSGIDDLTGGSLTSEEGSDREAYKNSAVTASQDSVDESNARLTTIQGHTYSINEECRRTSAYCSQMLSRLFAIERNTSHLLTISTNIAAISSDIETIKTKGVIML